MENKFCFLKGIVECPSGVIQNCNNMRTEKCPLDEEKKKNNKSENKKAGEKPKQNFCFFKGELVDCSSGRVQDCNNQRSLRYCPLEKRPEEDNPWEKLKSLREQNKKPDKAFIVSLFRELMWQEFVSDAMMELMEPEIKKKVEETRRKSISEAVEAMRDLGHDDKEIKRQLMIHFELTNREVKGYL